MSLKSAHTAKVGKSFVNARVFRSMTQEEIATQAVINIEYIKAIESGDYTIFPARIFAVQYFEKYAKFLNLEIRFFDIYNAEIVAAAEKEIQPNESFFKKNIMYIFIVCFIFFVLLIFILQGSNSTIEISKVESEEILSEAEEFKRVLEINFDEDINKLHDKINNFFIQDKLDSIQLDVNVNSLEPDA
jgi:cytoskeletal protein RodZ